VPPELGENYIFVNLPEFTLKLIRKGEVAHVTRTVVGKPDTPTPLFSAAINSLIVNPSWHVPQSIIRNEFLPKLAEDPAFAEKSGYEITQDGDMTYIRQPPGERNALGFVKFNLPNEHAVYLHDTPMRKLFANTDRAYSHGCVRVENPFSLAAMVLNNPKYAEDALKSFIGRDERVIKLEEPLPVHLAYFTVITGEDGQLKRLGDIYGYDNLVLTALKLDQNRSFAALK
jgi:murein L,D-transpeptidase YcbB/YkuD